MVAVMNSAALCGNLLHNCDGKSLYFSGILVPNISTVLRYECLRNRAYWSCEFLYILEFFRNKYYIVLKAIFINFSATQTPWSEQYL